MDDKALRNEKKELRYAMRAKRRFMQLDEIEERSKCIAEHSREFTQKVKEVCIFLSAFKEPDTFGIIEDLWAKSIKVAVPISNTDTLEITLSYIESKDDLVQGAYNIYEPSVVKPAKGCDMDVIFVPGLAFDRSGGRMGFGKGYYDKFLKRCRGTKVGICYDFQLFDSIPTEEHDIPMDYIITDKEILEVKANAI